MNRLLVEESGKYQTKQIERDGSNGAFGRKIFSIEMVDAAAAGVRSNQLIGQLRHVHAASIPQRFRKRKRCEDTKKAGAQICTPALRKFWKIICLLSSFLPLSCDV